MRTVTVHERLNIRERLARHTTMCTALNNFEAFRELHHVNDTNQARAKQARRRVADVFTRCTGRSIAVFLGWAK